MKHLALLALVVLLSLPTLADEPAPADHSGLWELYSAGQKQQAHDQAAVLLADHPDDRDLRHLLGRCLFDLGDEDAAREHLQFCVTDAPHDWRYAWSLFYLGGIAVTRGDDAECRRMWTEVRDSGITANVAKAAASNLKAFGLDETFADWPVRDTEHLHLVFSPQLTERDLDEFARVHEDAWHTITEAFGGHPEYRTRYIVWFDDAEAQRMAGIPSLGFAKPEHNLIHCAWQQTVGHELTHVVCYHALQPVERTGLINEGLAVAHDLTERDQLARARAAMKDAGVAAVDLGQCWNDPRCLESAVFYPVAGAWIQFLLERKGRETVLELGRNQTLAHAEAVIGLELVGLMEEFEGKLNADG